MATGGQQQLASELQCPICLDFFRQPVILPCSHMLCLQPCAERLVEFNFVKCPVCRDQSYIAGGVGALPRVLTIENIICIVQEGEAREGEESTRPNAQLQEGDIACHLCDTARPRAAHQSCVDCNASYCYHCLAITHPARLPFSSHRLVPPRLHPRPREAKCEAHEQKMSLYCEFCADVICDVCAREESHDQHSTITLQEAEQVFKMKLHHSVRQLRSRVTDTQSTVTDLQETSTALRNAVEGRQGSINEVFDSLLLEIEAKRSYFLSDLETEHRQKEANIKRSMQGFSRRVDEVCKEIAHAREVMKLEDSVDFLRAAKHSDDRLLRLAQAIQTSHVVEQDQYSLSGKVIDIRKEKAALVAIHYLKVPKTPEVDTRQCYSGERNAVVSLKRAPPGDKLDGYRVMCRPREAPHEAEVVLTWMTEDHVTSDHPRHPPPSPPVLVLTELRPATPYLLRLQAFNRAGFSLATDSFVIKTLEDGFSTIPEPSMTEGLCRRFTSSVQVYSASPAHTQLPGLTHLLLYRPCDGPRVEGVPNPRVSEIGRGEQQEGTGDGEEGEAAGERVEEDAAPPDVTSSASAPEVTEVDAGLAALDVHDTQETEIVAPPEVPRADDVRAGMRERTVSGSTADTVPEREYVYRCVEMYGRLDHRVFGLEPCTPYQFTIVACNAEKESVLSHPLTLCTEGSPFSG